MLRPLTLTASARRAWLVLLPDWADRNVKIVLAARVGMSVGRALASIVTALYLAAIGYRAVEIGILFVVVSVASAAMSTTIGLLADRVGRRPFLIAVPLLAAGAGIAYAFSRDAVVLFVAAAAGSFGRGSGAGGGSVGPYQPAESALVAETVPREKRAAAFSRVAFASSVGALFGGLAAQLVHTHPHMSPAQATVAYRPAFLFAAALAAAAGLAAVWLREPAHRPGRDPQHRPPIRWPRRSWPALWRFWITSATNGAGIGLFGPFVSYWFFRRYGATPAAIGLLFALVNAGSLASTLAAARVAHRLGTVRAIVTVRAIGGALLVPMVLAPAFWAAGGIYFFRMLIQRVGMPLRQSFTQDMADPDERASVAALSSLPLQATMAAGQGAGGWLFDSLNLAVPFTIAAIFQLANAAAYWLLFTRHPPRRPLPVPGRQRWPRTGLAAVLRCGTGQNQGPVR